MSDHIDPVQNQTDWPAMLHDLEKQVEVLSDALEGVKLAMRRLVLAEPWLEQATATQTYGEVPSPAYALPVATPPAPAYEAPAVEYDEDAREAVRRAVEEAKAQMASGEWQDDGTDFPTNYVTEDKPEVSWVTVPEDGTPSEPLPDVDGYLAEEPAGAEASSEAPAEMTYGAFEPEPVAEATTAEEPSPLLATSDQDEEAAREAVRRAVEEARAEMAYGSFEPEPAEAATTAEELAPVMATTEEDEEAAREAVRRAVEDLRNEMAYGTLEPAPLEDAMQSEAAASESEEDAHEAARRAVEAAKAEMGFGTASDAPPVEDEEAAREAVRQAVAQARAEMANGGSLSEEAPQPVEVAPAYVVPPPHRPERVHPPTITIEDPEGRVELALVYNLLKHLECAANSSLLNYSSRQVAVQLNDKAPPPVEVVAEAVQDVFERQNEVQVDGLNIIVKLGQNYIRAA